MMGLRTVGWARGTVELGLCGWERWVGGGYAVTVGGGGGGFDGRGILDLSWLFGRK